MSAFMCSNKTLSVIANAIASWHNFDRRFEEADKDEAKILRNFLGPDGYISAPKIYYALFGMNAEAVLDRYEDSKDMVGEANYIPGIFREGPALVKTLQSYLYQCTEGDVMEKSLYKFVERMMNRFAVDYIMRLPEYEDAPWG